MIIRLKRNDPDLVGLDPSWIMLLYEVIKLINLLLKQYSSKEEAIEEALDKQFGVNPRGLSSIKKKLFRRILRRSTVYEF